MSEVRVHESQDVGNQNHVDVDCVLYSNGVLVTSTLSKSSHWTEALRAKVFSVLYDSAGRALWVSQFHECRTACAKGDWSCSSTKTDAFQENIPEVVALTITGIDIYEFDGDGRNWRDQWVGNVKEAIAAGKEIYDSVPPEVKAAIAAALA
jgi:hypothetical protein